MLVEYNCPLLSRINNNSLFNSMTQNFALDSVHKVNQVTYGNDDNDDDREEVELFSQPTSAPKRRDIAVSTV